MRARRLRWLLAAGAAGLVGVLSGGEAQAQVSYGYDSLTYGYPPAQAYYYSSGYASPYTDPSTAVYADGTQASGPRTLAPYGQPPYGSFGQGNGLGANPYGSPSFARTAPAGANAAKTVQRRGIFGRTRTSRR